MSYDFCMYLKDPHPQQYDYELQVWTMGDVIMDCCHPAGMKRKGCCNAHQYAGLTVARAKALHGEPKP